MQCIYVCQIILKQTEIISLKELTTDWFYKRKTSVYCAVRAKTYKSGNVLHPAKFDQDVSVVLLGPKANAELHTARFSFSLSPNFRQYAALRTYSSDQMPNLLPLLPAPNSPPPNAFPSTFPKILPCGQPTFGKRTSRHCLGTHRSVNFQTSQ